MGPMSGFGDPRVWVWAVSAWVPLSVGHLEEGRPEVKEPYDSINLEVRVGYLRP